MRIVRHRFCEFTEVDEHWESIKAMLQAAVDDRDYTAAATYKQQLDELTTSTTTEAPPGVEQHQRTTQLQADAATPKQQIKGLLPVLEKQLDAAVAGEDYGCAATLKQRISTLRLVCAPAGTSARQRQDMEVQLQAALAKADYKTAATVQQQIKEKLPTLISEEAPARKRQRLEEQLQAAHSRADYTAAAGLKEQLGLPWLPLASTFAKDPVRHHDTIYFELQQALTRADYTTAAELKQELDTQPPATISVIDQARARLEKRLKEASARADYTAAAMLQQQIEVFISIPR